jgi:DNA-binding MarR family transcriptional regulator
MSTIGNVPEIKSVKKHLDELKERGLVKEWEIPYEHLLSRLSAAIFFLTPSDHSKLEEIWTELEGHKMLQYRINEEKKLSILEWRVEFNKGFSLS